MLIRDIFAPDRDAPAHQALEEQIVAALASRGQLSALALEMADSGSSTASLSAQSTEAQVRSAEQTAQATLARYQGGFGSILDLITAQQDESNARVQRIQSYLEWFTTLSRLQIAVGAGDLLKTSGGAK